MKLANFLINAIKICKSLTSTVANNGQEVFPEGSGGWLFDTDRIFTHELTS